MLNTIVLRSSALARHQNAPLLRERESYLRYLMSLGRSRRKQRDASNYLIQVVQRLKLTRMRKIRLEDLRLAANQWRRRSAQSRATGHRGSAGFLRYAKGWLRYHGRLIEPKKWNVPSDRRVELYKRYLQIEMGFAHRTVENRVWGLNRFLAWLESNEIQLHSVSVAHIERYFDYLSGAQQWKSTTIASTAQNLKVFFRYAEGRHWTRKGVSRGIFGPRIYKTPAIRKGPDWQDVCRLIESTRGNSPNDRRARAVLLLLSVYGLRASEISNLTLRDVNLKDGILTIRRNKNHLVQRLPLEPSVRTALETYIQQARPASECARVFLTLGRPYGPIGQASLYNITRTRMRRLGINSVNKGPHSLRHACANHLLTIGTPVTKVASLLGHGSSRYVGSYIQHTVTQLRSVAEFSLRGLLELN